MIPFGKRIKSTRNEVLILDFPESERKKTLPAGRPTLPVDSFIRGEYYAFIEPETGQNLYLRRNDEFQEIVEKNATDESGIFSGIYSVTDWLSNTKKEAERNAGFLKDGFKKSVSDLGVNLSLFGGRASYAIISGLFVGIVLFFIIQSKK